MRKGNPLAYQKAALDSLGPALQAAAKEWAEAEAADSQHQKLFASVRDLADALQRDLVAFRRCLMIQVGRSDRDYQKLRAERVGVPDEDRDHAKQRKTAIFAGEVEGPGSTFGSEALAHRCATPGIGVGVPGMRVWPSGYRGFAPDRACGWHHQAAGCGVRRAGCRLPKGGKGFLDHGGALTVDGVRRAGRGCTRPPGQPATLMARGEPAKLGRSSRTQCVGVGPAPERVWPPGQAGVAVRRIGYGIDFDLAWRPHRMGMASGTSGFGITTKISAAARRERCEW